jgi:hypothetical protein
LDNTTSKAWSRKGCTDSLGGQALSGINSALLLGSHAGLQIACITTTDNVIADRISHILHSTDLPVAFLSLTQAHIVLCGFQQFRPNAELFW